MIKLLASEVDLLARRNLNPSDVYDGRTEGQAERSANAERLRKNAILRDPSRSQCGHRLTTRSGHCISCKPAAIGFQIRSSSSGYVYIAGSPTQLLLKLGFCKDIRSRLEKLKTEKYADVSDWGLLFYCKSENAGAIESMAHSRLSVHSIVRAYLKGASTQEAREIYACKFSEILIAIAEIMREEGFSFLDQPFRSNAHTLYERG